MKPRLKPLSIKKHCECEIAFRPIQGFDNRDSGQRIENVEKTILFEGSKRCKDQDGWNRYLDKKSNDQRILFNYSFQTALWKGILQLYYIVRGSDYMRRTGSLH